MKARIKSNGHIVNVHETGERVISKNGIERIYISDDCSGIYYIQSELEFLQTNDEDTIDWNQVRIQAAIAAMKSLITCYEGVSNAEKKVIEESVICRRFGGRTQKERRTEMKRIIKFRGKRIENGEWVYGYLADEDYINDINSIDLSSKQVNPETVGQFSLFYDKNGKEIYEDDILKFYHNNKEFVCVVGWNNKVGAWCIRLKYEAILGIRPLGEWLCDYLMEKNGNIHDNPELLEGGSDEE